MVTNDWCIDWIRPRIYSEPCTDTPNITGEKSTWPGRDSNQGPLADCAITRTTDWATQPHRRPVTPGQRNKGSHSENFTICLGPLSPLVTSLVATLVHATSSSLCIGQCKYQRFKHSDSRTGERRGRPISVRISIRIVYWWNAETTITHQDLWQTVFTSKSISLSRPKWFSRYFFQEGGCNQGEEP